MHLIFCCRQRYFLAQKLSREVWRGQNSCPQKNRKKLSLKRNVCQHFAALKSWQTSFVLCICDTNYRIMGTKWCLSALAWVLTKSWQTSPLGKMLANIPPPKSGGLIMIQNVSNFNFKCPSPPKPPWYQNKFILHGKWQHGRNSPGNSAHYSPHDFPPYFPHDHQNNLKNKWNHCFSWRNSARNCAHYFPHYFPHYFRTLPHTIPKNVAWTTKQLHVLASIFFSKY